MKHFIYLTVKIMLLKRVENIFFHWHTQNEIVHTQHQFVEEIEKERQKIRKKEEKEKELNIIIIYN